MDFDLRRRLRHPQHWVLMIVRLHDAPVFQRDFLHHFAQAIYDCALHLRFGGTGIDNVAADVARDPDFIHFDFLVCVDGDFGDFGKVTAMAEMERDAQRRAFRQLAFAPARFLCHQFDNATHARCI